VTDFVFRHSELLGYQFAGLRYAHFVILSVHERQEDLLAAHF
jgi:hypothetical protein